MAMSYLEKVKRLTNTVIAEEVASKKAMELSRQISNGQVSLVDAFGQTGGNTHFARELRARFESQIWINIARNLTSQPK